MFSVSDPHLDYATAANLALLQRTAAIEARRAV
jgi:hypothetical protein